LMFSPIVAKPALRLVSSAFSSLMSIVDSLKGVQK
jgi:hypothetical protein